MPRSPNPVALGINASAIEPIVIGARYPLGANPTIYPQWYDIPMDWIVASHSAPRSIGVSNPT